MGVWKKLYPGIVEKFRANEAGGGLLPGEPVVTPEAVATKPPKAEKAIRTSKKAQDKSVESVAEKPAVVAEEKPAEATAVAATEPPSGKGRVLSDISKEGKKVAKLQEKTQAKNIAALPEEGEPTEEAVSKGKNYTKEQLAAFDENNRKAEEIGTKHFPQPNETLSDTKSSRQGDAG